MYSRLRGVDRTGWVEIASHYDDFGGRERLGAKLARNKLFRNFRSATSRANASYRQVGRKALRLPRESRGSELLLDCLLELLKLVGNLAQSQPQYFRAARRWKASRMGYFDFKRIAGTRGAFDDLTNSHDSGWGNRSQKLHGEVDVRRFDPAHLRIDLLQVRLQVRDSPPDGFGYLDTDERAYRIGLSVACLFLSSRHLAGRSASLRIYPASRIYVEA